MIIEFNKFSYFLKKNQVFILMRVKKFFPKVLGQTDYEIYQESFQISCHDHNLIFFIVMVIIDLHIHVLVYSLCKFLMSYFIHDLCFSIIRAKAPPPYERYPIFTQNLYLRYWSTRENAWSNYESILVHHKRGRHHIFTQILNH
jgi:hypothetical protein